MTGPSAFTIRQEWGNTLLPAYYVPRIICDSGTLLGTMLLYLTGPRRSSLMITCSDS